MRIIYDSKIPASPLMSIILLDWSIRESYHILYYLNNQIIPREQYEIIWIEYYSKQATEIKAGIEEAKRRGVPPIVDKWIIMDMPENIYYHKHLMYNIGILTARGKIITFCDSDAIVTPTFVESNIKTFKANPNIVLHMDEARNNDKRFYPFNYPSIEEVIGEGCINWKNGKTTGLVDDIDPLHTRNYGACMSALREDLIKIGGADEHIDYLGHICGPYEMTFRLINAGKKEVWHQEEFLYHVWHPGQAGEGNYLGPHDGKYMSTTALRSLYTKRVLPLTENPAIREVRLGSEGIDWDSLNHLVYFNARVMGWKIEDLKKKSKSKGIIDQPRMKLLFQILLLINFIQRTIESLVNAHSIREILWKVHKSPSFISHMSKNNLSFLERCEKGISELKLNKINEVVICGDRYVANIIKAIALEFQIGVKGIYSRTSSKKLGVLRVRPVEELRNYDGKIVCAVEEVEENLKVLKAIGLKEEQIIIL